MSRNRKSYQSTASRTKNARPSKARKVYSNRRMAFNSYNAPFETSGAYRSVTIDSGLVYKRPHENTEPSKGILDFDFSQDYWDYLIDNGYTTGGPSYDGCLGANQSELELYEKFGKKVSCLVPILLDRSDEDCIVMREAIAGMEDEIDAYHNVVWRSATSKTIFADHEYGKRNKIIRAKVKNMLRRLAKLNVYTPSVGYFTRELSKHYYAAWRNGLDGIQFVDDVLYIYEKTQFFVLEDGHADNVGIYRNNYCVLDYADNGYN